MGGGLVFDGDFDMGILFDKALEVIDHNKSAQGIADTNMDMAEVKFPNALELLLADGKLLEGSSGMHQTAPALLLSAARPGNCGKREVCRCLPVC